ncbi:hypothetical protein SERLA73DRAFT_146406 [Serpula lacrymans var. lacrymans S7.3]|uniref:Uncharacterized protein n=2 Tax=Serpula lacrymans var. lacrymans TaxID=341189 RepID=F8QFK4_SERL3|nr:uncharacterized protein SERLADRAFT_402376 [Serpula lacrymans var. lacrymans S7.9]EGN92988.1 hypothetical protein SERLA73DRAFT_146406 [Serpula lacrymans var. lacrymans S7.3]EGO19700.1 hypothetical protein SERLADRAFT_402376 [Serpula lacrymans var. lacrymans S7.9]
MTPPGLPNPTRRAGKHFKPHPLYLRLNTVPVSPSDTRFASSLSLLPSTPSATCTSPILPPTPCTPAVPSVAEVRRKRMAKLARHLGENVPCELVFPNPSAGEKRVKRRSMSLSAPRVASTPRGRQDWVGEWNRGDIRDVQRELRALKAR